MRKLLLFVCIFLFLPGCYSLRHRIEDMVHGWDSCSPVTERCTKTPEEFYNIPIIYAQNSWRGRPAEELIAAWGRPDRVEELSQDSARYVWVQEFTSHGELRYEHDNWKNEWDLVRQPDQTFVCETYMIVDGNGIVTPGWVNRLGACNEYFSPRPAYIPGAR